MSKLNGKWGTSEDEERYQGGYDTKEDAIEEAKASGGNLVAQYRNPKPPEQCINADDIIDRCVNQDDYVGEWAEDWLRDMSKEQEMELTTMLRDAFGAWLDRHCFRPEWGIVKVETIESAKE